MSLTVTVITIAECLGTDCNVLGGKRKIYLIQDIVLKDMNWIELSLVEDSRVLLSGA
jgi:hypothetical protein